MPSAAELRKRAEELQAQRAREAEELERSIAAAEEEERQAREAEERRIAEEKRVAEERRVAEEKRKEEEARRATAGPSKSLTGMASCLRMFEIIHERGHLDAQRSEDVEVIRCFQCRRKDIPCVRKRYDFIFF